MSSEIFRPARLLRLLPAAIAAYELRFMLAHLRTAVAAIAGTAAGHSLASVTLVLLALGAGAMLREAAHGLGTRLRRPSWSIKLLSSWLLCSAVLAGILGAVELAQGSGAREPLLSHVLMPGDWVTAGPAVALAGLLLALSLNAAKSLLGHPGRLPSMLVLSHRRQLRLRILVLDIAAAAGPLETGWSDRGPPRLAPAT